MTDHYILEVAGLSRRLQLCPVNENLSIAGFIMFSDVELTIACAEALLKRVPDFDILITAESKGIPLAYEMARQSGKNYILARKSRKLYMHSPIKIEVTSITTSGIQELYLDREDMTRLHGRKTLIVDDVVSTGASLASLEHLVKQAGGEIAGKATVLAEGEAAQRRDLLYLAELPLFNNKGERI